MLHETSITCPSCHVEFPLTETLAQPFISAERAKIQRETQERAVVLNKHERELAQRQKALDDLQHKLDVRQGEIDAAVEQKLCAERDVLAAAAEKKAAAAYADRLSTVEQELAEKQGRLAEAENAELALRKERRLLEEEKQGLELEVERRLQAERLRIREATQKEEEQTYLLKLAEKEKVISDMKKQVEELRRKSEQSSQQLQGEVLELELEAMLRAAFPADLIEPVPKGRNGGDVVHKVVGPNGLQCGTILWESKRTRSWSDSWLAKNREDQRLAGANVGAIVTTAMPKGVETFDRLENVWVAAMRCALPLAKALRHGLIEAAMAKVVTQGKDGKMERLYEYLIGPLFRNRVSAMRMKGEEAFMANQINVNEVAAKSGRRGRSAASKTGREKWLAADAARFLFKGQCYDAGLASDATCSLCAEQIRLVYVLKVMEFPSHRCAQEVGKLNVGECCFSAVEAVNEKLYRQLLAAAVNLRTYIEAIEWDQRIFQDRQDAAVPEKVRLPRLEVIGAEEDLVRQLFEGLLSDGGDHA